MHYNDLPNLCEPKPKEIPLLIKDFQPAGWIHVASSFHPLGTAEQSSCVVVGSKMLLLDLTDPKAIQLIVISIKYLLCKTVNRGQCYRFNKLTCLEVH